MQDGLAFALISQVSARGIRSSRGRPVAYNYFVLGRRNHFPLPGWGVEQSDGSLKIGVAQRLQHRECVQSAETWERKLVGSVHDFDEGFSSADLSKGRLRRV